jgi:LuxR family maltose regulon positive regulatory protein
MNRIAAVSHRSSPSTRRARYVIPQYGAGLSPLPCVRARLDQATDGVVIVSAPAGYSKTSQVALWAAQDARPVVWADLETSDNDSGLLTTRLASMLQSVAHLDGRENAPMTDATSLLAVTPITEMFRVVDRPIVVVLDDVHVIENPQALDVLGAAVNNVSAGSTIVLIGRSEPDISLGRLRVENRVHEIAAADLALTGADARAMFESLELDVDDLQLEAFVTETEGWPVGLRLAALALCEDADLPTGSLARDRIIAEYVHDQWLRGLDADDMDFLLRISGLEWLSGRVCDEILGRSDSGARLHRLHRSRMLVTPLDRRDDSYRLHSLLRDVLDADFERIDRKARRAIDLAASSWFERHGDIDRAVRHAVRSGDDDLVARLVEDHATMAHTRGRYTTVRRWLDQLPAQRVRADPALCLVSSLTAVGLGQDEAARAWLHLGVAASHPSTDHGTPSVTHLKLLTLQSLLSVGPIGESLADANAAYDQLPPGIWHAAACHAAGVLSLELGLDDLAAAKLTEGAAEALVTGAVTVQANCRALLAVILAERGDWAAATAMAREARQLIRSQGLDDMPPLIVITAMSAHVEAVAGDPVTARGELLLTRRNISYVGSIGAWANVQARISLAHASLILGDRAGARVLIDEVESYLRSQPDAAGSRARLHAVTERLGAARGALPVGPSSLTTAELRVLHLLPTNLSIADIAERLYVSRNTAKSHAAAVYRKLGVSSRSEAVTVARQGGLLPS